MRPGAVLSLAARSWAAGMAAGRRFAPARLGFTVTGAVRGLSGTLLQFSILCAVERLMALTILGARGGGR